MKIVKKEYKVENIDLKKQLYINIIGIVVFIVIIVLLIRYWYGGGV